MFAMRDGGRLSTRSFATHHGEVIRFLSRIEGSASPAKSLAADLKKRVADKDIALIEKIFLVNLVLTVKVNSNSMTRGRVLRQAFPDVEFDGVRPYEMDLEGANLKGIDLSGFDFSKANLYRADFEGANLTGANFHETYLEGASLKGTYLDGASFYESNLKGVDFRKAFLYGAYFEGVDLSGANFFEAHLEGALFEGGDLTGVIRYFILTRISPLFFIFL